MFGVKKKFNLLSGKHCLLIAMVGVVVITIPSVVNSACNARCDEYSAFNRPVMVNNQPVTTHYEIITPANPEFFACFRIWILDGDGLGALVDTTETETWTYQESEMATEECVHNGGIYGASLVGEGGEGPDFDIECASDCQEEEV